MNIFSLDDYRKIVSDALAGTGAFLRISRAEGLFVTDAKRRNADMDDLKRKLQNFSFIEKNGLLYLTPKYGFSDETNRLYTGILKSDSEKTEKLIRCGLALALRTKNQEQIELFRLLYERTVHP